MDADEDKLCGGCGGTAEAGLVLTSFGTSLSGNVCSSIVLFSFTLLALVRGIAPTLSSSSNIRVLLDFRRGFLNVSTMIDVGEVVVVCLSFRINRSL